MSNNYIIKDNFAMRKIRGFNSYDKIIISYNHLWLTTIAIMSNEGITLIPILPSSRWIFTSFMDGRTSEKCDLSDKDCIRIIGVDNV
jgi:hypothetical protein